MAFAWYIQPGFDSCEPKPHLTSTGMLLRNGLLVGFNILDIIGTNYLCEDISVKAEHQRWNFTLSEINYLQTYT